MRTHTSSNNTKETTYVAKDYKNQEIVTKIWCVRNQSTTISLKTYKLAALYTYEYT